MFHITKRPLVFVVVPFKVDFKAGKVSHSYNMATFPLFIVNIERSQNFLFVCLFFLKMHTDLFIDSQAERLLVYAKFPTLARKKKKKKRRRFNYFGIDALVTKYRPFYSFLFSLMFSFARVISPSPLNPDHVCVSQYRKKGRFVVVLPSHLRCSPFKRHRLFYKLCDCE